MNSVSSVVLERLDRIEKRLGNIERVIAVQDEQVENDLRKQLAQEVRDEAEKTYRSLVSMGLTARGDNVSRGMNRAARIIEGPSDVS